MAKRFVVPFAATGDKTTTPDATDPAGAISYSQGWGAQYQLPDTDPSYRPVGRQEMNGVLNDITGAVAELQQLGYPEWVAVAGLVTPYAINAVVRHNNVNWRNTIANNSAEPGAVGVTTWVDVNAAPPLHGIARYTASGSFTVPVGVTTIYASGCGAGGGGGATLATDASSFVTGGSGGGAGQPALRVPIAVTPGQVIPIVIGSGGTGGTPAANNATAGSVTQLGTAGALLNLLAGAPGLLGSGGTTVPQDYGGPGGGSGFPQGSPAMDTVVYAGGVAFGGMGGMGANSPFGMSGPTGRGAVGGSNAAGPGFGYGAGGSGAGGAYKSTVSAPGAAGAAGLPGILIIEW